MLRPDRGPGVGVGHVARCLALAQAWIDGGGTAVVADDGPLPSGWDERYAAEGVKLAASASAHGWPAGAAYVLDGYRFGPVVQRAAPDDGPLLVVDDLGQVLVERADAILDQNLGAEGRPSWPTEAVPLLGPSFALLRRELVLTARSSIGRADAVSRILVSAGGTPPAAWLELLRSAVANANTDAEIVTLDGRADVAKVYPTVQLALTAAGSSVWELLAFGVPCVVVAFADNQRPVARALGAAGVAVDAGDGDERDEPALAGTIEWLVADLAARRSMALRGRSTVDGRGAVRVASALLDLARF